MKRQTIFLILAVLAVMPCEAKRKTTKGIEVSVAQYRYDRECAVSLTFDDGIQEDYTLIAPHLDRCGLKGTNSYSGSTMTNNTLPNWRDRSQKMEVSTSFISRCTNLGNPDIILICGGTNDEWNNDKSMGNYKSVIAPQGIEKDETGHPTQAGMTTIADAVKLELQIKK